MLHLTDTQCTEFSMLSGSFCDMIRAIYDSGRMAERARCCEVISLGVQDKSTRRTLAAIAAAEIGAALSDAQCEKFKDSAKPINNMICLASDAGRESAQNLCCGLVSGNYSSDNAAQRTVGLIRRSCGSGYGGRTTHLTATV